MFAGIQQERFGQLTAQEERLLDNVKKAFHDSDEFYRGGRPEDCLAPMCTAIDAAKTLRRSLRGEDTSSTDNRRKFKEFIDLEVPVPDEGGLLLTLEGARSSAPRAYSFSDLIYAIRCMVHENENLNAAEQTDYHILLDWGQAPRSLPPTAEPISGSAQNPSSNRLVKCPPGVAGVINNGRITLNGHFIWGRLRELMSKFITGIDATIGIAKGADRFTITIHPPLGSIRPPKHRGG